MGALGRGALAALVVVWVVTVAVALRTRSQVGVDVLMARHGVPQVVPVGGQMGESVAGVPGGGR